MLRRCFVHIPFEGMIVEWRDDCSEHRESGGLRVCGGAFPGGSYMKIAPVEAPLP